MVKNIWIDNETLYINFNAAITNNSTGKMTDEINTVFSVVKSLTDNFFSIKLVQIVVENEIKSSLRGHIDISHPLAFKDDLYERMKGITLPEEEELIGMDKKVEGFKEEILKVDFE